MPVDSDDGFNPALNGPVEQHQPPQVFDAYQSTRLRGPRNNLIITRGGLAERTAPVYGHHNLGREDSDLTVQHDGAPLGQKIVIAGQVRTTDGRPVPHALIELWQANASGRYTHKKDQHPAPLDPNFSGAGRTLTDARGCYRFITIAPGAYPWGNHFNGWRPAHVHFSVLGAAFSQRLITQMYFPGDPLLAIDPIFMANPDRRVRELMVARYDRRFDIPGEALGYRFDMFLGPHGTPLE